jgi:hypothetical protein
MLPYPVKAIGLAVKPIVTPLTSYKQHNEYGTGNTHCQPGHIDERVTFVFGQITKGNFEIIFEHDF